MPGDHSQNGFLAGQKVVLRGLRQSDLSRYRRWLENPVATHFMESGWRPISDSEMDALYKASTEPADTSVFIIEDRSSGKSVGVCGLYLIQWICRRAEFRILIGEDDFLGKGLGSEAAKLILSYGFEKLNLETIYLGVNSENLRAIGSYRNAGFQDEGVRRRMVYRNSKYYDVLMMSVLREEYFAAKVKRDET